MNTQKTIAACFIAFVLSFAFVVHAFGSSDAHAAPMSAPAPVMPDVTPPDLAAAMPAPVQVAAPVLIVGTRPTARQAPAKAWTCGAPRGLENDETQTVRPCEWR